MHLSVVCTRSSSRPQRLADAGMVQLDSVAYSVYSSRRCLIAWLVLPHEVLAVISETQCPARLARVASTKPQQLDSRPIWLGRKQEIICNHKIQNRSNQLLRPNPKVPRVIPKSNCPLSQTACPARSPESQQSPQSAHPTSSILKNLPPPLPPPSNAPRTPPPNPPPLPIPPHPSSRRRHDPSKIPRRNANPDLAALQIQHVDWDRGAVRAEVLR